MSVVRDWPSTLPSDDHHLYRSGAWTPQTREWDASRLTVLAGEVPTELVGTYLRNTENPLHEAIGLYHPFDGDGMVHAVSFAAGQASYRNRFVRTAGLLAEAEAGRALWTGMLDSPERSVRPDGWGARGRMKDSSSTDVVVHRGRVLTTFWQCGEVYAMDPVTLADLGTEAWVRDFGCPTGVSAHTKVDPVTGELIVFGYAAVAPHLWWGVVSPTGTLTAQGTVELPGPRLPHDIAFTEHWIVLNDLPVFWDPTLLDQGVHLPRFFPELPSRLALVPRTGGAPLWFEADPTYVLHWSNAWEDADGTVVLEGYFQHDPEPARRPELGRQLSLFRHLAMDAFASRPHRWRLDPRTGTCREEQLSDTVQEFGLVDARRAGRRHDTTYAMSGAPGRFLFDGLVVHRADGSEQRFTFPPGVFASEAPFAPRPGSVREDDGWLVTLVTDAGAGRSECWLLDAADVTAGPVCRLALPEQVSSGTHSWWQAG